MKRALSALSLPALVLSAVLGLSACDSEQSGESNPDSQVEQPDIPEEEGESEGDNQQGDSTQDESGEQDTD